MAMGSVSRGVVAVVLIGCEADESASPPVEVATTVQATVASTSLPERTGRPTVLPLSGPAASGGVGLIDCTEVRLLTAKAETIGVGDAAGFSVNHQNRPVDARIEGGSVALRRQRAGSVVG